MSDPWIVIPEWEHFQHRDAARVVVPTWIKLYTELLSKDEFYELSFHLRGMLVSLWIEYARSKRQLRGSTSALSRRLGHRVTRRDLAALEATGLLAFSASKPASSDASTNASVEERREEKRREEEPLFHETVPSVSPELHDAAADGLTAEAPSEELEDEPDLSDETIASEVRRHLTRLRPGGATA